jgi:phosphoserine phosphatase RsbX
MTVTVSHVTKPKIGERVNGDAVLVRDENDALLLAVVDGLGHGPIAAEAAQVALAALATQNLKLPMMDIIKTLHDGLRGTRGVAATLCLVRGQELEACAVGNVQLTCTNANIPLVLSAGVLGMRVAKFHVCRGSLRAGARIGLFSDGISSRISLEDVRKLAPEAACQHIFERFRKNEDDATILIADFG